MTAARWVLGGVLAVAVVVGQTSVVGRLRLPLGAAPDVVLLVVVGVALVTGPAAGAAAGFGAGLLVDSLADHPLGVAALVLCLIGYAGGRLPRGGGRPGRALVAFPVTVAAATMAQPVAIALTLAATGRSGPDWTALGASLPAAAAANVILAVLIGLAVAVASLPGSASISGRRQRRPQA